MARRRSRIRREPTSEEERLVGRCLGAGRRKDKGATTRVLAGGVRNPPQGDGGGVPRLRRAGLVEHHERRWVQTRPATLRARRWDAAAAENALRSRPKDEEALNDEQLKKLKQKVGELVLDLDILREAAKGRPTDPT